jgi:hypothetical protein
VVRTGERETYLVSQIAPLQPQVSADVLVNGPGKLVVQLPSLKCKQKGRKGHQTRQGNQQRTDLWPKRGQHEVLSPQALCGVLDLVKLNGGIDEDAEVVDDETDDLNRVLEAQGVPYEP